MILQTQMENLGWSQSASEYKIDRNIYRMRCAPMTYYLDLRDLNRVSLNYSSDYIRTFAPMYHFTNRVFKDISDVQDIMNEFKICKNEQ